MAVCAGLYGLNLEDLRPGIIIKGRKWPEPLVVNKVERHDRYVRIIGSLNSGSHIDQIIPINELGSIGIVELGTDFAAEGWKAFLALESIRYRYASIYDPLLAMNVSKVDPLPHQIDAVYGEILKRPRIRFMIADDPGAGKTIMAGLVMKELKLRNLAKRFLLVVPGHLKDQWIRELKERFEETLVFVNREYINSHYGENVWEKESQLITSIDFAKQEDIIPSISASHFDLVIVDEAHKMSAYKYGEKTSKTARYQLGEILSRNSEHLLFLTATPHKGDPENFRLLIDLLEPGFFADVDMVINSINSKDNPLFIRRIKEDLKDFEGRPLFLPRYVKTVAFNLSEEEMHLYNEVSKYVYEQYNKALAMERRRNIAFALIILQRRMASSTYALLKSLMRRRERLKGLLEDFDQWQTKQDGLSYDLFEEEDESEEERWEREREWEALSVAGNRGELEKEISVIDGLINKAKDLVDKEADVKLQQLKKTMEELNRRYPHEKVLIFTESRDTMEYLERKIRSWGYAVNTISGKMSLDERIKAEGVFKNETQVMVATEAAGEGINLQFCHLMINYDIPWNPNRLEQRMGRVHRYGQTKEVFIYNLVAADTREGKVLKKLFDKLDEIRSAMNSDKVFDVISEVLYGKDLYQLLIEAAANARDSDEILRELDIRIDEEYIKRVKENLGMSLATKYINYTGLKEMAIKARESRLIPEYTKAFFVKAFSRAGGRIREKKDGFAAVESIPYELRRIAEDDGFRRRYGCLQREYPVVTFDKEAARKESKAEFVSFGHPLFEALLEWVSKNFCPDLIRGSVFTDPEGKLDGYLMFHEGEVKDGTGAVAGKRLFAHYLGNDGAVRAVPPSIIWDLKEEPQGASAERVDLEGLKGKIFGEAISELESYMGEIQRERERQAGIKEKYGIKSLEILIDRLDGDIIRLEQRKDRGEDVDLALRNKREQKKKYENALRELRDTIEKERSLTMSAPRFLGILRVVPAATVEEPMKRDVEVERVGMEVAMEHERSEGRIPIDVSAEELGFDIKSLDQSGTVVRYIEVKARSGIGSVALTQNEWFKAQRLGKDYYLYAVVNAKTKEEAKLYVVRDPASTLKAEEWKEVVRYLVPAEEIIEKGIERVVGNHER